jgi:phosphoserine phosphatase
MYLGNIIGINTDRKLEKIMMNRLIVFDLDGTLTPIRSSWEFVHRRLGLWEQNAERHQDLYCLGKIPYEKFSQLDAQHWKGLPRSRIEAILAKIPFVPGTKETIARLKNAGHYTAIVSSGLSWLAARAKTVLGVDAYFANELLCTRDILNGRVRILVSPEQQGRLKGDYVRKLMDKLEVAPANTIAVGDSAGDIDMFMAVATPVLVNATPHDRELVLQAIPEIIEIENLPALGRLLRTIAY